MELLTSTTWPTHHVTILYIESINPNKYFLLVLRLSSNGQAQTWKAMNINVMFSHYIKLMNFLLGVLTVLRNTGRSSKINSWICAWFTPPPTYNLSLLNKYL